MNRHFVAYFQLQLAFAEDPESGVGGKMAGSLEARSPFQLRRRAVGWVERSELGFHIEEPSHSHTEIHVGILHWSGQMIIVGKVVSTVPEYLGENYTK